MTITFTHSHHVGCLAQSNLSACGVSERGVTASSRCEPPPRTTGRGTKGRDKTAWITFENLLSYSFDCVRESPVFHCCNCAESALQDTGAHWPKAARRTKLLAFASPCWDGHSASTE